MEDWSTEWAGLLFFDEDGNLLVQDDDAMDKATFGGDRSAAGRYAAQVRWGRGRGTESSTSGGAELRSDASPQEVVEQMYPPEVVASFTEEERDAVVGYGQSGGYINEGLRNDSLDREDWDMVDQLDSAIEKAPPLPKAMTVYRGIDSRTDYRVLNRLTKLKVGQSFQDDGYSSSSLFRTVGERFGNRVLLEIALPKGHRGLVIGKLGGGRGFGESEMLLARETRFKVTGRSTDGSGRTILQVVPQETGVR